MDEALATLREVTGATARDLNDCKFKVGIACILVQAWFLSDLSEVAV